MAPIKLYKGDEDVLTWEHEDDLEPKCSIDSCGKAAAPNGYCEMHNAEIRQFVDAFKALSNEAKEEVFYNAFKLHDEGGWELQGYIE